MPSKAPAPKPGLVGSLQRKAGPLPVWAWSLLLLAGGYYLYRRYQQGNTSTTSTPTLDATAIPVGDQAGGGLGGGGAGTNAGGGGVYNYYHNNPKLNHELAALEKEIAQLIKIENRDKAKAHIHRGGKQTDKATGKGHEHPHDKSKPTRSHTKTRRGGGSGRPKVAS